MDRSDLHREALDVIEQGLMMIGETKNEEELPVNFSDLDEKTMVQFLEAHYEFQQPFTKDELESWQGWQGRGISGEYLWSVTLAGDWADGRALAHAPHAMRFQQAKVSPMELVN